MDGNQEVITLVATCMALLHYLLDPVKELDNVLRVWQPARVNMEIARRALCILGRISLTLACLRITVCTSALHNQEVQRCCVSYVFATLSESEGHVGLFLYAQILIISQLLTVMIKPCLNIFT